MPEQKRLAQITLRSDERKYHSRINETIADVRAALLAAPEGTLVVTVERAK